MGSPGRPSLYTPEIAKEISERISNGEPLAVICRDPHMPAVATVNAWRREDENFSSEIAHAREAGYDAIAYATRETARLRGESTGDVQRDKLIIENDHKLLAKWDPTRYGDKQQVEHSGQVDVRSWLKDAE